ncbi:MAG: di-heme oxidoredictase family protein [bacterium]
MNRVKIFLLLLVAALLISPGALNRVVTSQSQTPTDQANRVSNTGVEVDPQTTTEDDIDNEGVDPKSEDTFSFDTDVEETGVIEAMPPINPCNPPRTEAPADFDNQTNGFLKQGDPVPRFTDPGDVPHTTFENDKFVFSAVDEIEDGLGPVYNAQSCRECHQSPVTGAISQITELRAGHNEGFPVKFVDAPGGSLINDRSIPTKNFGGDSPFFGAKVQERVPPLFTSSIIGGPTLDEEEPVRTFRTSLNLLGDGFVEAIANGTFRAIRNFQAIRSGGQIKGQIIKVPVLEANIDSNPDCANPMLNCIRRIGRFGWKDQHASLLSFSGDAYLNEMGITNELVPKENSSLGRSVADFDPVADPEDDAAEDDIGAFTAFMRSTKAPPIDPDIRKKFAEEIKDGRSLFFSMPKEQISCSLCHVPRIVTAKPCTKINGGTFQVPFALGNKIFHPFSDFLLHDVGTGDGIVQNGPQTTRLRLRTPALWGVRTRTRLMHDGESLTFRDAILRHAGEATPVINSFQALTNDQRRHIIMFLESL